MKLMRKLKENWLTISLIVFIVHLYFHVQGLNKDVAFNISALEEKNEEIRTLAGNFTRIEENMAALVTSNAGGSILNGNNSTVWSNLIESDQWKPLDPVKINPLAYPQHSQSTIDALLGINRFRSGGNFANPLNNNTDSGG